MLGATTRTPTFGLVISSGPIKVPACAAHLPETFPVGRRPGYVVHLHFVNGNIHNLISGCVKYAGNVLGELD